MSMLEIVAVERPEPEGGRLWWWSIDRPLPGARVEAGALEVVGWVLGRAAPAVAVELVHDGAVVRRARLGVRRPDLAARYPHVPGAEWAGFTANVSVLGATPELELGVRVVLRDQTRVLLGVIRAKRGWREADDGAEGDLVSVIIPCYRQAHFLGEAIESVLRQTYPHVEVVVVDDGSPDNAEAVAARYPGVRYIRQSNQGRSAARNAGLRWSNGNYVVFLDSDDRLLPGALGAGLAALKAHPECAFVYGHHRLIGSDGAIVEERPPKPVEGDPYAALLRDNYIMMNATVMYRRSVFQAVGIFDTRLEVSEDYDLYLRVARRFPICGHGRLIAEYRHHGTNVTADSMIMLKSILSTIQTQWKYVRGDAGYRKAYRESIQRWKNLYGARVVKSARQYTDTGDWKKAIHCLFFLLRYYPRGVPAVLFSGWAGLDTTGQAVERTAVEIRTVMVDAEDAPAVSQDETTGTDIGQPRIPRDVGTHGGGLQNLSDTADGPPAGAAEHRSRVEEGTRRGEASQQMQSRLGQDHDALPARDSTLVQQPQDVSRLHGEVAERDATIAHLHDEVAERGGSIARLHEEVAERDETIAWLHEEVAERDETIAWLHEEVSRRDATVEGLRAELGQASGQTADSKQRADDSSDTPAP
jgi:glycosyltransferase involved in cell wall biosynthesis